MKRTKAALWCCSGSSAPLDRREMLCCTQKKGKACVTTSHHSFPQYDPFWPLLQAFALAFFTRGSRQSWKQYWAALIYNIPIKVVSWPYFSVSLLGFFFILTMDGEIITQIYISNQMINLCHKVEHIWSPNNYYCTCSRWQNWQGYECCLILKIILQGICL